METTLLHGATRVVRARVGEESNQTDNGSWLNSRQRSCDCGTTVKRDPPFPIAQESKTWRSALPR